MFDAFKSVGIFVIVSNSEKKEEFKGRIPIHLRKAIRQKGAVMPLVVVSDTSGNKPIMGFCAKGNNSKSVKRLARDLKKKLKANPELISGSASTEPSTPEEPDEESSEEELLAEEQEWTNSAGKTIVAAVIGKSDQNVIFLMNGKKRVEYPIYKLSQDSIARLEDL